MKKMGIPLIIIGAICLALGIYFVARSDSKSQEETSSVVNENYKMGKDFEEYVVNLLNPRQFKLIEKVNDYSGLYHKAERNKYCDIVFRDKATNKEFAIECKYRSAWHEYNVNMEVSWVEQYKIDDYNKFSRDKNMSVVVMLGVGGTPDHPADLYCIPLRALQEPFPIRKSYAENFRLNPDKPIYWSNNIHNLENR